MAGQLVGEVLSAVEELQARGVTERGFQALIAIAEGCRVESRQGSVPFSRIQAGLFGASRSTAERAIRNLKTTDVIRVAKRGFNNHAGRACAPIYEIAELGVSVTQVTETEASEHVTQVTETGESVSVKTEGRFRQIDDRSRHLGEVLPVSITGSISRALPKCTGARCTVCDNIRIAIKNCGCDKYGRLDDLSDCPDHGNFRIHVRKGKAAS